jgi:hypothetical protein
LPIVACDLTGLFYLPFFILQNAFAKPIEGLWSKGHGLDPRPFSRRELEWSDFRPDIHPWADGCYPPCRLARRRRPQEKIDFKWFDNRCASAPIVRAVFDAPVEGNTEPSQTNVLLVPWTSRFSSTTPSAASDAMRHMPLWCAPE